MGSLSKRFNIHHLAFIIIFLAFILRLLLIPHPGFEADVSFWKSWGLATYDKGIVEGMKVSNNNYPTPFAYTLGMMVKVYSLFKDPHNFNEYWSNTNELFLLVSKLPAILADFGIAALIILLISNFEYLISRQILNKNNQNPKRFGILEFKISKLFNIQHLAFSISPLGLLFASVYLLNPISLIDGAWWGQVDSLGVFIFLLAILAAFTKRPMLAGVIYMAAVMTKLQNMIYGPLFFLFIWQSMGYQGLVKSIGGSMLAFFGLNIEFLLAREMGRVIDNLTQNYDYFPWMSLNAFNLWWIVSGAHGMQVSDKLLSIGIANAKTVGLLLFSSFYLFAVLNQLIRRVTRAGNSVTQAFIESLIVVNAAFFLFQTQSHDRYAFPLIVFLLLWIPFTINTLKGGTFKGMLFFYSLFTIFYFYNLHTALVLNYPNNGLPFLSSLTQPFFTITTSIILLALFGCFIWYIAHRSKLVFLVACCVFLVALLLSNLPLLLKKPVSITKLTPFVSEQGYSLLQKNMPVNASLGFNNWSPLSVQYVFYRSGLGTHAPSRQTYHINGLFKRFTADYGIDTEAGSQASAIFQIYGDDSLLFQSEEMGRYIYPKHTDVDITGVKILTLVTTDAEDGTTDDHTDWLRPTLWP